MRKLFVLLAIAERRLMRADVGLCGDGGQEDGTGGGSRRASDRSPSQCPHSVLPLFVAPSAGPITGPARASEATVSRVLTQVNKLLSTYTPNWIPFGCELKLDLMFRVAVAVGR